MGQFLTADGTDDGDLSEIRRLWVQDGKVLQSSLATPGHGPQNSLTDSLCQSNITRNDGTEVTFTAHGGMKSMGEALGRGMVLSLSVWDDPLSRMLWLDGQKLHPDDNSSFPGVARGPCSFESGDAKELHKAFKDSSVTFTNIKYGEFDSTYSGQVNVNLNEMPPNKTGSPSGDTRPVATTSAYFWAAGGGTASVVLFIAFLNWRLPNWRQNARRQASYDSSSDEECQEVPLVHE